MRPTRGGWQLLLAMAFVSTRASLTLAQTDSTSHTRSTTSDTPNAIASPSRPAPALVEPSNPAQLPANPTTTSTPDATAGMAYGSNDRLMFIQGGNAGSRGPSNQFFSLDFTQSWTVDAPAWRNLTSINAGAAPSISGIAGTLTKDDGFLVVTQQNGEAANGSIYEYKFSQSRWFPLVSQQNANATKGPLAVTDLDSGIIYFLGDGLSLQGETADPSLAREMKGSGLTVPSGQAGSWSAHEKRLLSTVVISNRQMDVQASGLQSGWTPLNTISAVPIPVLNNHCFVPNTDGSKYYMFGGSFVADNKLNGELFILDVQSKSWSRAPMASPRTKMACAVAGNSLVIWGGYQDVGETLLVNNRPIIFDIAQGQWVQRFTTTFNPFTPKATDAGSANPTQGSSASTNGSKMGAIIGGSVGGMAVVTLIAGLFIFSHRRRKSDHRKGFDSRSGRPASSSGKGGVGNGELSKGEVEMGGYKTIPSPFSTDDPAQFSNGSYRSQNQQLPAAAPYLQQQPPQQQPPIIPSRPTMASSHSRAQSQLFNTVPLIITSPFDTEADASLQHPLLCQPNAPVGQLRSVPLPPLAPRPPSVQYQYHGQRPRRHGGDDDDDDDDDDDPMSAVLSRSLEPTTVDLIPISASEAGDGSLHSRANSVSSNRSLSSRPRTTRTKSRGNTSGGARGAAGGTSGVDNDRGLLEEPGDGRRGSTDSLDYLDIS